MATKKPFYPGRKFRPEPKGKRIPIALLAKCYARLDVGEGDAVAAEFCKRVIIEHKMDAKALKLLRHRCALWSLVMTLSPAAVVASAILYAFPAAFVNRCRKKDLALICTASGVEFARPDMATDQDRYDMAGCKDALWQWLSPNTKCCLCGVALDDGRRYVCGKCGSKS